VGWPSAVFGAPVADQLVDLPNRLARHVLDRRKRVGDGGGVAFLDEPRTSSVHQDHVYRMRGGVVQVPHDPGAFLGRGEPPLALQLSLLPGLTGQDRFAGAFHV